MSFCAKVINYFARTCIKNDIKNDVIEHTIFIYNST